MATSSALSADVQAELLRRHKSTATTVLSLLVAVVLLSVLAFVSQKFLTPHNSSSLDMTFRIIVPILGLGAIALRRTRLAKMRLQDIAAIRGRIRALSHSAKDRAAHGDHRNCRRLNRFRLHAHDRASLVHVHRRRGRGSHSLVLWLPPPSHLGTSSSAILTYRKQHKSRGKRKLILPLAKS